MYRNTLNHLLNHLNNRCTGDKGLAKSTDLFSNLPVLIWLQLILISLNVETKYVCFLFGHTIQLYVIHIFKYCYQDNRASGYDSGNYTDFTADSSEPGRHVPKSRSIPDYQNFVPNPELRVSSMHILKHNEIINTNIFNLIIRFRTSHLG